MLIVAIKMLLSEWVVSNNYRARC